MGRAVRLWASADIRCEWPVSLLQPHLTRYIEIMVAAKSALVNATRGGVGAGPRSCGPPVIPCEERMLDGSSGATHGLAVGAIRRGQGRYGPRAMSTLAQRFAGDTYVDLVSATAALKPSARSSRV